MCNYKISTFSIMCIILFHISDIRASLECESSKGLIYKSCLSACGRSNKCSDRLKPFDTGANCIALCVEGCVCEDRNKCQNDEGVCVENGNIYVFPTLSPRRSIYS